MLKKILRLYEYPKYLKLLIWKIFIPLQLKKAGARLGRGVKFYGKPIVSLQDKGEITIGERCILCSDSGFTELGVNHPVILRLTRPGAVITIGPDTGLSGATILAANAVKIGSNVLLGANVTIIDNDGHAIKSEGRRYNKNFEDVHSKPVLIGDNVFIGANAIVLKGVQIGENSIIGAGSVVSESVPANVIAAGNPAKIIRCLN